MYKRSIKELLQLLLANKAYFIENTCTGLCPLAIELRRDSIITQDECYDLLDFMINNVPNSKWQKGIGQEDYKDTCYNCPAFHFEPLKWAPRARYLRHHIKRLVNSVQYF